MRTHFYDVNSAAREAIEEAGGSITLGDGRGAPNRVAYDVTFPEGTEYDGPTNELRFKQHRFTLPGGRVVDADCVHLVLGARNADGTISR